MLTLSPSPSINTKPIKQQYEELDGDVLDYPSINRSLTPSEDDLSSFSRPRFSLRRLSSPVVSSKPTKPAVRVRSSLPSIPKLSLKKASQKRNDKLLESVRHYGCKSLHFTLFFSPSESKLTITVLGLYRGSRKLSGATIRAHLLPLGLTHSLGPDAPAQVIQLQVRSAEELQVCVLRLSVSRRDFSGLRETAVGDLELVCAEIQWEPDSSATFSCQLTPAKRRMRKSQSSHDALGSVGPVRLLVLLQYQTLAQRMKVMVRKAENLPKLTRMPGTPDHYVVINLRQDGEVISTKETKASSGANAVWNAPFLFDLPAGEVSRLPLQLELRVMQRRRYTKSCILGRVLIGCAGSEAGSQHWSEMCSRPQVETAFWHELQPDFS
ncbi:uncharacterized protein [Pseudorasbora parva]